MNFSLKKICNVLLLLEKSLLYFNCEVKYTSNSVALVTCFCRCLYTCELVGLVHSFKILFYFLHFQIFLLLLQYVEETYLLDLYIFFPN